MKLIIGGLGSGKEEYLNNLLFPGAVIADGRTDPPGKAFTADGILFFEEYVKRILLSGGDPGAFTRRIIEENKRAVITQTEIGCGVVPLEKTEREYREIAGRCGCMLAASAEEVIRMVCGIGVVLKSNG